MFKVLGAIAVLAAVSVGCGSSEGEQTSSATPTPTPTATPTPELAENHQFERGHTRAVREYYGDTHGPEGGVEAEYHQPPTPATGKIGDTITLTGTNVGIRLDVKVTGLVDPVAAARPPREGMRHVAVGVQVMNTGFTIHDDTLDQALLRYDARGKARPLMGVKAKCSHGFQRVVRIEPSAGTRGCVLFEVPGDARPRSFLLALEQVPPEVGGRWRLR